MQTGTVKLSDLSASLNLSAKANLKKPEYTDAMSYGSLGWTRSSLCSTLIYSDGIEIMIEKLQAYWFVDVVASYIPKITKLMHKEDSTMFFIDLFVKMDDSAKFRVHDGGRFGEPVKTLITQRISFTDCPNTLRAYLCYELGLWK